MAEEDTGGPGTMTNGPGAMDDVPQGTSVEVPPQAPSSRSGSTAWSNPAVQAGLAIAAIALIAIVGMIALSGNDDSSSTSPAPSTNGVYTTTTIPASTACKMELAGWLDYALAPGGSLSAAAAEFGVQSPEYVAVETAWSKFAENTYVVGADQASTLAVESLATDCDTIGDNYVPGHIAPN